MIMRKPDPTIIRTTLEGGANGYLAKPVSFDVLEQEVNRVLRSDQAPA